MFEGWYWFDLHLAFDRLYKHQTSVPALRLISTGVFLLLVVVNGFYFYSRQDAVAAHLSGDQEPSVWDLDALAFFSLPIIVFGGLLWL
jgi:hypothetical protein